MVQAFGAALGDPLAEAPIGVQRFVQLIFDIGDIEDRDLDARFLGDDDAREELLKTVRSDSADLLGRPLGNDLDLPELMAEMARHYLERARAEADGNKTRAAELIGLPSYQTLTNWMGRYDISLPARPSGR